MGFSKQDFALDSVKKAKTEASYPRTINRYLIEGGKGFLRDA